MKRILSSAPAVALAVIAAASFSSPVFSQGIKLQAGAGIGYAVPNGDYAGTTAEYYAGSKYGLSGGVNFHAKGRIGAAGFQLGAEIGYSSYSNSGSAEASGQGKVEISQKVLSVKIGPEYMINIPAVPLKPYLGANLALNTITGTTTFTGVALVPSGTFDVKSAVRFGLGVGGGLVYKMGALTSLDFSFFYNFMNLFGRKFEVVDLTNPKRIDSYARLNDDKDVLPIDYIDHIVGAARTIRSLEIGMSLMFGI